MARTIRRRFVPSVVLVVALAAGLAGVLTLQAEASPVIHTVTIGPPRPLGLIGPVAVAGHAGRIYVGAFDGDRAYLRVLDTSTGAALATILMPAAVEALAVDELTGHLFVATVDNSVRMIDPHGGAHLSIVNVLGPTALTVDERGRRVYVTSSASNGCANGACLGRDGAVAVLDADSGGLLSAITLAGEGQTMAAFDPAARRLITIGSGTVAGPSTVSLVDAVAGRTLHRLRLPGVAVGPSPSFDAVAGRAFAITINVTPGSTLYTCFLNVVSLRRGGLIRRSLIGSCPEDMAVDDRAGLVALAEFGPTKRTTYSTPTGTVTAPIPAGDGGVRLFDSRSGALVRTIMTGPATTAVAFDRSRGRLFVAHAGPVDGVGAYSGPGWVSVMDERTGRIVRNVAVGVGPEALVVDERAGRLIVVNAGTVSLGQSADPLGWVPAWLRGLLPFIRQAASLRPVPSSVTVLDATRL